MSLNDNKLQINRSHSVFLQIQGQMHICNIATCVLVVFVPPDDIEFVVVKKENIDDELDKLADLWFTKLLPHFVSQLQ